jgi:coenzyme PQQ precursor peptide PqqA
MGPHTPTPRRRYRMTWVKPDFEVVELGMEVTAYVYTA